MYTGSVVPALLGIVGFVVVILVWYAVRALGVFRPGLVPTPLEVLDALVDVYRDGELVEHVWASVRRIIIGVLIGVAAAVPAGFLLGWYRPVRMMVDPLINFFRALPPIALIPLVIVYFGIGEFARTSVLVYASFFAAIVVIYEGVVSIEAIYVRAAQTLGATEWEIFSKVALPLTVPSILVALRVALGVSWATVVAAELIAAQEGLGALIQNASNFFQIPTIYGGIILIGVSALVMDQLLRGLTARLVSWQERARP
ncbi:MAG: ABC transporter permease [Chloroflexia bacterium]|nr:ABC transporter permease [Chloroflexia bacterium]